jgi:hypothetical protein
VVDEVVDGILRMTITMQDSQCWSFWFSTSSTRRRSTGTVMECGSDVETSVAFVGRRR